MLQNQPAVITECSRSQLTTSAAVKRPASSVFYDSFHMNRVPTESPHHRRRVAQILQIDRGMNVLDVGCGQGEFLHEALRRGANPYGIDISSVAVTKTNERLGRAVAQQGNSEKLPFSDASFDRISSFGALEHFENVAQSLAEMYRVGNERCRYLFLVPNADFLPRKLSVFSGTNQRHFSEHASSLEEWQRLFVRSGFTVEACRGDPHVFCKEWISARGLLRFPLRALQAAVVTALPKTYQYQNFFLCSKA